MKKRSGYFLAGIVLLLAVSGIIWTRQARGQEIVEIKATQDLGQRVKLYQHLIARVGPEKAQDDLLHSGLPFDGQTHLLNHTVGEYLYQKDGATGLTHCRDYFLSSCYHGFLLTAIASEGVEVVEKAMAACHTQGPTTEVQCAHAVGHGFLAWLDYPNLPQALELCDSVGQKIANFGFFNCYDGVFMENIWGVHHGQPSPERWIKTADPVYPCNDPRIDEKYRRACWANQPALAYQLARGDLKKSAAICQAVTNPEYQRTCFNGLARQIHPVANGNAVVALQMCGAMPTDRWKSFCAASVAQSAFSVGDRQMTYAICQGLQGDYQKECYTALVPTIRTYTQGQDRAQACAKLPEEFRPSCL